MIALGLHIVLWILWLYYTACYSHLYKHNTVKNILKPILKPWKYLMQSTTVIFAYFHIYARTVTVIHAKYFLSGGRKKFELFYIQTQLRLCCKKCTNFIFIGLLCLILFIINDYVEFYANQSNSMQVETNIIAKA